MGRYQVRKDTGTQVPTYFGQDSIGQRRCGNWGGLCRRAIPPRYECRGFPRNWMKKISAAERVPAFSEEYHAQI
jgi:hypothetical protein